MFLVSSDLVELTIEKFCGGKKVMGDLGEGGFSAVSRLTTSSIGGGAVTAGSVEL